MSLWKFICNAITGNPGPKSYSLEKWALAPHDRFAMEKAGRKLSGMLVFKNTRFSLVSTGAPVLKEVPFVLSRVR